MEKEILRLVSESVKHITDVYGEPSKITKYGNSIILTFNNGKKYRIGLIELFNYEATLD